MKLVFLVIAILINFFNPSLIKSEEKINLEKTKIEYIANKEPINENNNGEKIHIVKTGDTISSISKTYSISKDLIIKLNKLKNENYIYVGQNLIISEYTESSPKQLSLINDYHIVQLGENLTDISSKYNLDLGYLIKINNIKTPDSIEVGEKLFLGKNDPNNSENYQIIINNELLELDKQIYGPIIIQGQSYDKIKGKKVLNVLNQENKKLILSINCYSNELDVRIPGRKWMGAQPAKEEFEKNLINDFC